MFGSKSERSIKKSSIVQASVVIRCRDVALIRILILNGFDMITEINLWTNSFVNCFDIPCIYYLERSWVTRMHGMEPFNQQFLPY